MVILVFIIMCVFSYKKTHSIIHPSVIVSAIWAIILVLYNLLDHDLYQLSNKFHFAVLLWVLSFVVSSLFFFKKICKNQLFMLEINKKLISSILTAFILINFIGIYKYYSLSGGIAYDMIANFARGEMEIPLVIRILQVFQLFSLSLFSIIALYNKQVFCFKYKIIIFIVSLFIWSVISGNKTGLFQIIFIIFNGLYFINKISLNKILIGLIILCIAMFYLQTFRSRANHQDSESVEKIISVYILSPLPAFDLVLNGEKQFVSNQTFRFFNVVGDKLGIVDRQNESENAWAQVPIYTNVYTVMFPFYSDFGYVGLCIFGFICGCFWSILYNKSFAGQFISRVLYAMFSYTIYLQFFSDYLFNYLSVFFQVFIFLIIFRNINNIRYRICV